MPRSMAMISSSGTWSMPFGRAAMSVSFSFAITMRKVEVRAAVPAFIDSFICSVKDSLRLIAALRGGQMLLYYRWCRDVRHCRPGRPLRRCDRRVLDDDRWPRRGSGVRRVVVGMLTADDDPTRAAACRGWCVGQPTGQQAFDPRQAGLGAEIDGRRHAGGVIEAAGGDLDGVAVEIAKGQRRAAGGAEAAFGGGRTLEAGTGCRGSRRTRRFSPCRRRRRGLRPPFGTSGSGTRWIPVCHTTRSERRRTGSRRSCWLRSCPFRPPPSGLMCHAPCGSAIDELWCRCEGLEDEDSPGHDLGWEEISF